MKILVIGGGGREHALVWKINQSPLVSKIYCLPGNAGIAQLAECISGEVTDIDYIANWAQEHKIDLTVIGPEIPLTLGLADELQRRGLAVFGPDKAAAQIEGSKIFCKKLLAKYNIPTADYRIFSKADDALSYIDGAKFPLVVKADGLAAGKGVIVCRDIGQAKAAVELIMRNKAFGSAGDQIIIEDCLIGEEASFLAFTDGKTVLPMISAQDHKAVYDNDQGPNTGGMGAYAQAVLVDKALKEKIINQVMVPAIEGLAKEGCPYKGVLYAGIMIVDGVPYVLEFNARFGDPETQAILPLLNSDIIPIMQAAADNRLDEVSLNWKQGSAGCVVMASGGYPGKYEKNQIIQGVAELSGQEDILLFHAGTVYKNGNWLTHGGRVLGVVGCDKNISSAIKKTYSGVERIKFDKMHYRTDIGKKSQS